MSKIILFGSQKGGVGKSTLTTLCANALSQAPYSKRVFVVDLDPQQSVIRRRLGDLKGADVIPPYKIEYKTFAEFQSDIDQLDQENEIILIDAPGKLDANLPADKQEITKILLYVDYLFIPMIAGNYSFDSTLDYLKIAIKVKAKRQERPLEIIGLINMSEPRTLDERFLEEELEELKAYVNIHFMRTRLNRYALFRSADTLESFYSNDTSDKARQNFTEFIQELTKIIQP